MTSIRRYCGAQSVAAVHLQSWSSVFRGQSVRHCSRLSGTSHVRLQYLLQEVPEPPGLGPAGGSRTSFRWLHYFVEDFLGLVPTLDFAGEYPLRLVNRRISGWPKQLAASVHLPVLQVSFSPVSSTRPTPPLLFLLAREANTCPSNPMQERMGQPVSP